MVHLRDVIRDESPVSNRLSATVGMETSRYTNPHFFWLRGGLSESTAVAWAYEVAYSHVAPALNVAVRSPSDGAESSLPSKSRFVPRVTPTLKLSELVTVEVEVLVIEQTGSSFWQKVRLKGVSTP